MTLVSQKFRELSPRTFWTQNLLNPMFFLAKILFDQNLSGPKFFVPKFYNKDFFGYKIIDPKQFSGPFFFTQIV